MLTYVLEQEGRRFTARPIDDQPITVGRAPDNALRLFDDEISRHHCRIEWRDGTLVVVDLSSNGTLVNGAPAKECELHAGDSIAIGPWRVHIEATEDAVSVKTVAAAPESTRVLQYHPTRRRIVTDTIDLVIRSPEQTTIKRTLSAATITLGTHADCDLAVADPFVSRRHCRLALGDAGLVLQDLDSTNGTFVGDVRVARLTLPAQGCFRIGRTTVHYHRRRREELIGRSRRDRLGRLLGASEPMRELFALIERVAPSEAIVCVLGESGTGKELVARELHERSKRNTGPFVAINCGALPPELIESQLFGHERGSFTGAVERAVGLIEQAKGGTLFLDEIGEMPPELQTRLLRVLEERTLRRLGGREEIPVNVRLLCATHRDLKQLVAQERFRRDLFYRLYVVPLTLPPLRERNGDVALLARHFVGRFTPEERAFTLTAEALERLQQERWPGNVRELRNVIERTLLLATGDQIAANDLALTPIEEDAPAVGLQGMERSIITDALEACGGNISQAARRLGMPRTSLQKKITRFEIAIPGR